MSTALTTFAPSVAEPPPYLPTGNLEVALPEIDLTDGSVASLGVVLSSCAGVVTARGGLAAPGLRVGGVEVPLALRWVREGDWLPHGSASLPTGTVQAWYVVPTGERGALLRLRYEHSGAVPAQVDLSWRGSWRTTTVEHLRSKPVEGTWTAHDDAWTGSRVVSLSAGLPLLALAWRGGEHVDLADDGSGRGWLATRTGTLVAGESLVAEVYVGVAPEPDGACTTALHLRRRGFAALRDETLAWLAAHRLAVPGRPGLESRLNANLFFSWFYGQADCLDDGRPVLLTSRSPHYYVCAAFWSRDAYCWTFPALLLTDPLRAREVLVATLRAGGVRLPDHALYLNGTSLYPGFELDQAAAPFLALARYVAATGDRAVLGVAGVMRAMAALVARVEQWRHPEWQLYGTFLLPTDDPTDFAYVTTCNALVAAAFDALADLAELADSADLADGPAVLPAPAELRARASAVRAALRERLVVPGPHGPMWAWACNGDGDTELRDEPPLGLLTLPYWGLGEWSDPVHRATRAWLQQDHPYRYPGPYGGAGAAHFPHPSGFDLANRLLDASSVDPDPLQQLQDTPMDQGLACESWDAQTGRVTTGAAMASMSGLLVWTAWSRLQGWTRWQDEAGR